MKLNDLISRLRSDDSVHCSGYHWCDSEAEARRWAHDFERDGGNVLECYSKGDSWVVKWSCAV